MSSIYKVYQHKIVLSNQEKKQGIKAIDKYYNGNPTTIEKVFIYNERDMAYRTYKRLNVLVEQEKKESYNYGRSIDLYVDNKCIKNIALEIPEK